MSWGWTVNTGIRLYGAERVVQENRDNPALNGWGMANAGNINVDTLTGTKLICLPGLHAMRPGGLQGTFPGFVPAYSPIAGGDDRYDSPVALAGAVEA